MIQFVHPEAFVLVPLLVLALRRRLWPRPLLGLLRIAVLTLLAAMLAQPSLPEAEEGRDVVLVVDHSRSMPAEQMLRAREFADDLAEALPATDRIGVVAFADGARVAAELQHELVWPDAVDLPGVDRSDLATGLLTAAGLVEPGRRATLVVWSDGEVPREASEAIARLIARRGLRIDVVPVAVRQSGRDVAVGDLQMPHESAVDEPFVVNAMVVATFAATATFRVLVDGELVHDGSVALNRGRNVIQLQHVVREPGEHQLVVEVDAPGDAVANNNRAFGVVRGLARTRVLCVTPGGREDRLTRSLRASGIDVAVHAPATAPLSLAQLDGYRAVVLENVPAGDLPARAMRDVGHWVRELGGGLLMTGGAQSFGPGGYYQSEVEAVLPVTLEIREQQRRFGLAMAIALDRSGSMRAAGGGGSTKMDLANRGVVQAIELLSPIDAVAVFAVDTVPDLIVPLVAVEDPDELAQQVRSIAAGGGGIYVGAALEAAAETLSLATQQARHIVLFADADDAEEPGDYRTLLPELADAGLTVSVIGLGAATGRDAQLLQDIAQLGGGRCQFVGDAAELPRVFAQETIQVARSSMVEAPTNVLRQAGIALLGDMPRAIPPLGGYSIAWLRRDAELDLLPEVSIDGALRAGAASANAEDNPLLAHWRVGLGRSAAFLGEVDGALSGEWADWQGYDDFFAVLVRWLCGTTPAGVFVDARRDGDLGIYELEVEADRSELLEGLVGRHALPDGTTAAMEFVARGPGRVEVRVPLRQPGVHRAAVQVRGETLRLPPLCLPYSPEWRLEADPRRGERQLRYLAYRTEGFVGPSIVDVVSGPRQGLGRQDLSSWCCLLALLLFVGEIAMRRLQVHVSIRWPPRGLWRVRRRRRLARRPAQPDGPVTARAAAADGGSELEAEANDAGTAVDGGEASDAGQAVDRDQAVDGDRAVHRDREGASGGEEDQLLSALERAHRRGRRRF
ncbi:MAG: VWA domain-containing protein [Planctomycetota bacterium]